MNVEYMAENEIDSENVIQTELNGCPVTVYFVKKRKIPICRWVIDY